MPANTEPIFAATPNVGFSAAAVTAANTNLDGTGTVQTIFTAGLNGAKVNKISFRAAGTNVQTVARIFLNNGGATSTASNNVLYREVTLAASSASSNSAMAQYDLVFDNFNLPAGYTLTLSIGTAVAAGWRCIVEGANF